jgi:ubiquinone/menaquinone biosynthesis C-methylase UbiE
MSDVKTSVQQQFGNVAAYYSTSTVHAKGEDLVRMVEIADITGTEQVLDAGCGAGHTALTFAPYVAQVIAYDLTPAMLDQVERLSNERSIHNIETHQGDVEHLPFEAGVFDLVVSRYSAHHWPHPSVAVKEFHRVLKPGGQFILSDIVAPDDPTQDTFVQAIELLRDASHVRDHSIAQWMAVLRDAGFESEVVFTWQLSLDFVDWITRMATPEPRVMMIKSLFDGAPQEVRFAMNVQDNYSFSIRGALFRARYI